MTAVAVAMVVATVVVMVVLIAPKRHGNVTHIEVFGPEKKEHRGLRVPRGVISLRGNLPTNDPVF